jgi:Phosphate-induced protein 1 conserved region
MQTAGDVKEAIREDLGSAAFCQDYCGYHVSWLLESGKRIYYAQAGIPNACMSGCAGVNAKTSPNNDPGADAIINVIAHEIAEAVSDPYSDSETERAWEDAYFDENADKCAHAYGVLYRSANGASANQKVNGKDYLIQQNWDPVSNVCASL